METVRLNKTYTIIGEKEDLQKVLLKLRVYAGVDCNPDTLEVFTKKANTEKTNNLIEEILNDNKEILKRA